MGSKYYGDFQNLVKNEGALQSSFKSSDFDNKIDEIQLKKLENILNNVEYDYLKN